MSEIKTIPGDVIEKIFLDDLSPYSINIRKQNFYIQKDQEPQAVGNPIRTALENNTLGREQLSIIVGNPYYTTIMELWGPTALVPDIVPPTPMAQSPEQELETAKQVKIQELNHLRQQTIDAGVDVPTSIGVKHFSLTQNDQWNLMGSKSELVTALAGLPSSVNPEEGVWYHADGEPHRFWSKEDIFTISAIAFPFVQQTVTYFDILRNLVNQATTKEDVAKITWGMTVSGM